MAPEMRLPRVRLPVWLKPPAQPMPPPPVGNFDQQARAAESHHSRATTRKRAAASGDARLGADVPVLQCRVIGAGAFAARLSSSQGDRPRGGGGELFVASTALCWVAVGRVVQPEE